MQKFYKVKKIAEVKQYPRHESLKNREHLLVKINNRKEAYTDILFCISEINGFVNRYIFAKGELEEVTLDDLTKDQKVLVFKYLLEK
jgi:hypothetical protein